MKDCEFFGKLGVFSFLKRFYLNPVYVEHYNRKTPVVGFHNETFQISMSPEEWPKWCYMEPFSVKCMSFIWSLFMCSNLFILVRVPVDLELLYPGNTRHKAGIYPGWDASSSQSAIHAHTHTPTHYLAPTNPPIWVVDKQTSRHSFQNHEYEETWKQWHTECLIHRVFMKLSYDIKAIVR